MISSLVLSPGSRAGFLGRVAGLLQQPAVSRGALAAVFVGAIVVQASQRLSADDGWLLIATRRLLAGRRLYVDDFVDPNPPLILYLLAPPVAAARALAISEVLALRVYLFALAGASIALCARLAAVGLSGGERAALRWWLILTAFGLLLLDRRDFGQREHLIALFLIPFLVHASACARGCRPPAPESIAAGLLAGLAVGLKPQYALVPCLALLGVFGAQRRLRVGTGGALAALGVVVVADLVLLKPDYLRYALPLALETYGAYRNPLPGLLRGSDLLLLAAAISAPFLVPGATALSRQARIFAPATAAAYGAYLISGTGWNYHLVPFQMLALSTLSLVVVKPLSGWSEPVPTLRGAASTAAGAGTFATVAVLLTMAPLGIAGSLRNRLEWRPRSAGAMAELRGLIDRHARDGAIWVISLALTPAFPVVNDSGVEWASRFGYLWPLPAVIRSRAEPTTPERRERLDAIERQVAAAVVEDLERCRPDLIAVPLRRQGALHGLDFDFLVSFGRDPRFAGVWSDYEWVEDTPHLRAYARRG